MAVTIRSRLALLIGALVLMLVPFINAQHASAASYGWNYISLPTWLGNCPGGGSVRYLFVAVGDTWSGGDGGDDLVYAKVRMNENQQVSAQGLCYKGNYSYWGPASAQIIRPTRQNQTWWVGPGGVTHN